MRSKYRWGLYYDPNDPRLVVPKINPVLGWTLNIAHSPARVILFLIAMAILGGLAAPLLYR